MQKSTNNSRLDPYQTKTPTTTLQLDSFLNEKKVLGQFLKLAVSKKIPVCGTDTGRFLELACIFKKPANILEIGCGIGFSTYFLVKHLSLKGAYTGIDMNGERLREAENFISGIFSGKNLAFMAGNAIKMIPGLTGRYDMVFIDASKFEYPLYIKIIKNKLLPGAIVIADNIFYKNKVFSGEAGAHDAGSVAGIRKYIDYISKNLGFRTVFFEVGDGLGISEYMP